MDLHLLLVKVSSQDERVSLSGNEHAGGLLGAINKARCVRSCILHQDSEESFSTFTVMRECHHVHDRKGIHSAVLCPGHSSTKPAARHAVMVSGLPKTISRISQIWQV